MWSPKQKLLQLTRSLRSARSVELPKDNKAAFNILLPLVIANQYTSLEEYLSGSSFDVNYAFGRVQKTLLHIAANCGHYECLTVLLKRGCDPNLHDISGTVALHLAARNGQKRCVEKLLECHADPDVPGNDGATAIHWLAVNGRHEILKVMLEYTSQVNLEDGQGHTALHAAARNGHKTAMECLIDAGADLNYSNSQGITPLHSACSNGQRHAISLLLSKGASTTVDAKGQTPLDLCLLGGYGVAAELLLEHSNKGLNAFVHKAVYDVDLDNSRVIQCIKYIATRPLKRLVAEKLVDIATDIGFQLLSLSTDCQRLLPSLKRSFTLLVTLCSTAESSNGGHIMVVFDDLEQLWKSVDDWLILLREDAECEENPCDPDASNCESQESEQSFGNADNSMLKKMSDRLGALVSVFYDSIMCVEGMVVTPQRFSDFIKRHKSVLGSIVNLQPTIIFEHFKFLFNDSSLMSEFIDTIKQQPFEKRYKWFYDHLDKEMQVSAEPNTLQVHRNSVFEDSCALMENFNTDKLKQSISIQFVNEEGIGDGVLREWFSLLSNEILNPQYCLFTQSSDGCTFQPCSKSAINPDHLSYFKFAGRILGLALFHRQLINASFTLSFYKHLLGTKVNYKDVASIDPEYAKNLQWILDNDVTDLGLELTFAVETDVFGAMEEIDLKPNGSNISVTQENKEDYVQLVTELRMTRAIEPQINAFLKGFEEIIPHSLIQIFTESELDLLLSGSPEINIEDWKSITNYSGCYSSDHDVIVWFWSCVANMNNADRCLLVRFVTGRSRLPSLVLAHRDLKFMITESAGNEEQLPTASTCMNMLKLPLYQSYDVLEEKLLKAVRLGSYGYAFT
ncbi:E3 ubiquitin-protein ligase HACE1-like [Clavelina lepadiformis]|uniref:E3 ubiquitin-protein ligase HACE1-like n=1 Tax=Clavelina lepadiformis TaxID=159417 RepID=UPI004041C6D0